MYVDPEDEDGGGSISFACPELTIRHDGNDVTSTVKTDPATERGLVSVTIPAAAPVKKEVEGAASKFFSDAPTKIKRDAPAPVVNKVADWAAEPEIRSSGELSLRRFGRSNKEVGPSRLGFEEPIKVSTASRKKWLWSTIYLQQYLPGHFDFITDAITDQENRLADAINSADCRVGKDKLDVLYTLSRVSGGLATRKMDLKQCHNLENLGQTAITRQCSTLVLKYGVDNSSKCGPQLRSGEFGISNDGFTLVPYTECYWKSSAVNFNGHAF